MYVCTYLLTYVYVPVTSNHENHYRTSQTSEMRDTYLHTCIYCGHTYIWYKVTYTNSMEIYMHMQDKRHKSEVNSVHASTSKMNAPISCTYTTLLSYVLQQYRLAYNCIFMCAWVDSGLHGTYAPISIIFALHKWKRVPRLSLTDALCQQLLIRIRLCIHMYMPHIAAFHRTFS